MLRRSLRGIAVIKSFCPVQRIPTERVLRLMLQSDGIASRSNPGHEPSGVSQLVNFAQTPERRERTILATLTEAHEEPRSNYEGPGENMKSSTQDRMEGGFHEVKGTVKEQVGKITNDHDLKTEGKAEKKAGKVQQRMASAKEAVTKLRGRLAELKKTG